MLGASERELAHCRNRLLEADARYEALFAKFCDLTEKMLEFQRPKVIEAPKIDLPKRDPVMEVVAEVAGSDGKLREHLAAWVRTERRKTEGMSDDAIIDKLYHWDEIADADAAGTPNE